MGHGKGDEGEKMFVYVFCIVTGKLSDCCSKIPQMLPAGQMGFFKKVSFAPKIPKK